jgi:AraC-like DNA-binding protein
MRCHLESAPPIAAGWLAAVADRHLSQAIAVIHADPAHPWTVEALASRAGLSRTAFSVRFRRVAGQTAISYLTKWRILWQRIDCAGRAIRLRGSPQRWAIPPIARWLSHLSA